MRRPIAAMTLIVVANGIVPPVAASPPRVAPAQSTDGLIGFREGRSGTLPRPSAGHVRAAEEMIRSSGVIYAAVLEPIPPLLHLDRTQIEALGEEFAIAAGQ
jgi:hypothetical protein